MHQSPIDKALFEAWRAGDRRAFEKCWVLLWQILYSTAFIYCRGFGVDELTAEELATDALNKTILEIDQKVENNEVEWRGAASFVAYVRNPLIFRCRSEVKRYWKEQGAGDGGDDHGAWEDGEPGLYEMGSGDKSAEETVMRSRSGREAIRRIAVGREMCRNRKKLVEIFDGIERFLQAPGGWLAEPVRPKVGGVLDPGEPLFIVPTLDADPDDVGSTDLPELIALAARGELDLDRPEMTKFLMDDLKVSRAVLDGRMRQIRQVLYGPKVEYEMEEHLGQPRQTGAA